MYAVEFQAPIENGIVKIPSQYQDLQNTVQARVIVMYETKSQSDISAQLERFEELVKRSNNPKKLTMELATNIDELVDDGLF